MTSDNPILIVIRGMPGSGKSFLADALYKSLTSEDVIVLDPDATDYQSKAYQEHTKALTAEGVDKILHPYRFLRAQAYDAIADHKIIIWNQPFTDLEIFHKVIDRMHTHAAEHHTKLKLLIVEVEIDSKAAKERVNERKSKGGHGPSENTLNKRIDDYKSFASEGYETVTVNGHDDVLKSVATVQKALQNL